jgi:hypothetical protein
MIKHSVPYLPPELRQTIDEVVKEQLEQGDSEKTYEYIQELIHREKEG